MVLVLSYMYMNVSSNQCKIVVSWFCNDIMSRTWEARCWSIVSEHLRFCVYIRHNFSEIQGCYSDTRSLSHTWRMPPCAVALYLVWTLPWWPSLSRVMQVSWGVDACAILVVHRSASSNVHRWAWWINLPTVWPLNIAVWFWVIDALCQPAVWCCVYTVHSCITCSTIHNLSGWMVPMVSINSLACDVGGGLKRSSPDAGMLRRYLNLILWQILKCSWFNKIKVILIIKHEIILIIDLYRTMVILV